MAEQSLYLVILRTAFIFIYAFVVIRLSGRHQLSQLTFFDFLIVIALGSAVGDAMVYSEDVISMIHSMTAIAVVAAIHIVAVKAAERSYTIRKLLYGEPRMIIHNGKLIQKNLDKEDLTLDQLKSLLREKGLSDFKKVKYAYIETTGHLSAIRRR